MKIEIKHPEALLKWWAGLKGDHRERAAKFQQLLSEAEGEKLVIEVPDGKPPEKPKKAPAKRPPGASNQTVKVKPASVGVEAPQPAAKKEDDGDDAEADA